MRRIITALLATIGILTGCAGGSEWSRPGTKPDAIDTALSQCRAEARASVREDNRREDRIFNDRESTKEASGYGSGVPSSSRQVAAGRQRDRSDAIIASCMHRQGFTRIRN